MVFCVEPDLGGQFDTKVRFEPVEDRLFERRRNADGPNALHVRVAADGHQSRVGPADHAAHQREIADHLHILDAVYVVRDPHGPTEDHTFRVGVALGNVFDLVA